MRTDREELTILRVSLARIAQAIGVDNRLQVKDKSFGELSQMAETQERGWNDLAGEIVDKITDDNLLATLASNP